MGLQASGGSPMAAWCCCSPRCITGWGCLDCCLLGCCCRPKRVGVSAVAEPPPAAGTLWPAGSGMTSSEAPTGRRPAPLSNAEGAVTERCSVAGGAGAAGSAAAHAAGCPNSNSSACSCCSFADEVRRGSRSAAATDTLFFGGGGDEPARGATSSGAIATAATDGWYSARMLPPSCPGARPAAAAAAAALLSNPERSCSSARSCALPATLVATAGSRCGYRQVGGQEGRAAWLGGWLTAGGVWHYCGAALTRLAE